MTNRSRIVPGDRAELPRRSLCLAPDPMQILALGVGLITLAIVLASFLVLWGAR